MPAVLVAVSLNTAVAQDGPSTLEPGARVRITVPDLGIDKQQATFQALRGDTLVVTADAVMYYPVASVTRLDVSRGRKGISWVGGAVGFVVGAAAGAGVAYLAFKDDYGSPCSTSDGATGCGVVVTGFALGGAVAGALLMRGERWEEVPLGQVRVSIVPHDGGLVLGVSVAF